MEFREKIQTLENKVKALAATILTEEATKNAFVMPFLHTVLGYDVFNPAEVVPEFTADVGIKKGEKIDYAIMKNGEVSILIECKRCCDTLSRKHSSQLYRYFSVTNAKIAILTNGIQYQFYTDIDSPNKMDEAPFLEFDFANVDEYSVPELKKMAKDSFDIDSIVNSAGELKYTHKIRTILENQFNNPDEDFVKFFASKVYGGILTPKVKEQFTSLTKKSLKKFLADQINLRLKAALASGSVSPQEILAESNGAQQEEGDRIVTTEEEVEAFHIVKAILREVVPVRRVVGRDTISYFGVLLDDNNRKPICRLHFNAKQKYIGLFNDKKEERRVPIQNLDDIYGHADSIKQTIEYYEPKKESQLAEA